MIRLEPKLPRKIINAAKNKKLAIFFGAGVSRLIGCDSWERLAYNLVEKCFLTTKSDGETYINYKEKETLHLTNDNKKVISICHGIMKQNDDEDLFFEELGESLKPKDELLATQNIYEELYNLLFDETGFRGLLITTNADEYFAKKFFSCKDIAYKIDDFNPLNIEQFKLYHIHGMYPNRESLVFTLDKYIDRYNPQNNFSNVLDIIFSKYTVIFIGYGMSEFELLDFLITKRGLNESDPAVSVHKELKDFILLPYYKGEENILKFEEFYYKNLGINVIGYEKDKKGYNQLYDVIKNWNEQLSDSLSELYKPYEEIDSVVEDYEKIGRKTGKDS